MVTIDVTDDTILVAEAVRLHQLLVLIAMFA